MRTATLIYNPVAGRNPARRQREITEAVQALRSGGIECRAQPTKGTGTATQLARDAVNCGGELIIACGGDGTLNEVVNGIVPSTVPLAILPGGTANIAAHELSLPLNLVRAARELPAWKPRRIAVGYASGCALGDGGAGSRYFLSVAGIGFDAYVIHKLALEFKLSLGVPAYVLEGIRQWMRYPFPALACRVNGRPMEAIFVLLQRTSLYAGWFRTAPHQTLTNDLFSVSLFTRPGRLRFLRYTAAVVTRQRPSDFKQLETSAASFEAAWSGAEVYYELDGELVGRLPANFEVRPGALTLLVP